MSSDALRRVHVRWMGNYRTHITVRGVHHLQGDETPQYGGEDAGPMPTEFFLVSIASCMCLAVYHVARKRRLSLDQLEVSAWGYKDMQAFRFNEIQVLVEANLDEIEKLVDLAKAYCFVSNTIIQGCPIHVTASQLEQREK